MNAKTTDPRNQQTGTPGNNTPACCAPTGNQPCCEPSQTNDCCTPGNEVACCEPPNQQQTARCC